VLLQGCGQVKSQKILRTKNGIQIPNLSIELKYLISEIDAMCEMIDEIEIEHLKMALARARKETSPQPEEEEPITVVAQ
jgi:hypothetical protein